jgi:hypothetical protein
MHDARAATARMIVACDHAFAFEAIDSGGDRFGG